MRLVALFALPLLALPAAAFELDPIAASVNAIDIEIAAPLIEAEFGPILDRAYHDGPSRVDHETPLMMVKAEGRAGEPVYFMFCDGRLAGFSGKITQQQLSDIYWQYDPSPPTGIPVGFEFAVSEMVLHLPTDGAVVTLRDLGGKAMSINLDFPQRVWSRYEYNKHCAELAEAS